MVQLRLRRSGYCRLLGAGKTPLSPRSRGLVAARYVIASGSQLFVLGIAFSQNKEPTITVREAPMRSSTTRRTMLKNAALAIAAGITTPHVRGAYAAGKL